MRRDRKASTRIVRNEPAAGRADGASGLQLMGRANTSDGVVEAESVLHPHVRHAYTAGVFGAGAFSGRQPGLTDALEVVQTMCAEVRDGDLGSVADMLVGQAVTLDATFTEMMLRSYRNLSEYPDAAERFMRLALKAQANSRATIEALTKMHAPREQVVRHVHVHEGGQAVVAEEFHHYARGIEKPGSAEQPHAQGASGSALLGQDPLGGGVPIAGNAERPVPNARRKVRRRAKG